MKVQLYLNIWFNLTYLTTKLLVEKRNGKIMPQSISIPPAAFNPLLLEKQADTKSKKLQKITEDF